MSQIYYKESFPLRIEMANPCGVATGVPDFDFEIRLISGDSEYSAGRRDGELYNCRKESDESLIVLVADHGLKPCRDLMCEIYYYLPDDASMHGQIRKLVRRYPTGLRLTDHKCACTSVPAFEALLPYIKGADGKPGPQGVAGKDGKDGKDGAQGPIGPEGPKGDQGQKGDDGKSAYEQAVESGYEGTESEFTSAISEVGNKQTALIPSDDINVDGSELTLTNEAKKTVFNDWWNRRCYFSSKLIVGGYYPDTAPDPTKPYLLNELWFSYEDAMKIAAASGPKYSREPWLYCHTYPGTTTLLPTCNYGNKDNSDAIYYCTSIVNFRFIDGYNTAPTTQYNTAGGTYNFDGLTNLERIVNNVLDLMGNLTAKNCPKLRELRFKIRLNRAFTINLQNSPRWEYDCIKFSIENTTQATSVTITVHPDVYAKLTGDTTNSAASVLTPEEAEKWQALVELAAAKSITFVSV